MPGGMRPQSEDEPEPVTAVSRRRLVPPTADVPQVTRPTAVPQQSVRDPGLSAPGPGPAAGHFSHAPRPGPAAPGPVGPGAQAAGEDPRAADQAGFWSRLFSRRKR